MNFRDEAIRLGLMAICTGALGWLYARFVFRKWPWKF